MTSFYESYIGTSEEERKEMLSIIGKNDISELFSEIPENLIFKDSINIPGPYSEAELTKLFEKIAAKNINPNNMISFLGGGVRQQYIPAALEELMRRGELYTAYTPYQPEVSQGMLQLLFEYQSMVSELLGMDIVNSSMYDWASAMAEALKIMSRITRKKKIIVAQPISPNRLEVTAIYLKKSSIELIIIESKDGNVDTEKIVEILKEEGIKGKKEREIAGIYFEFPNYFGTLAQDVERICSLSHDFKGLVTVGVDPIAFGIIKPPGDFGADFVVGEGQMLGNSVNAGGPLLGILASKFNKQWIRQIPGRLIGATTEVVSDNPGYCITLQTREQHIRREKATSNICSNQALTAVTAAIYLASLGKQGLIELSQSLMDRAHYLADKLNSIQGVKSPKYNLFFFSEFLVEFEGITHDELEKICHAKGIIPGVRINENGCTRLIGVSELHIKDDLDNFYKVVLEVMS